MLNHASRAIIHAVGISTFSIWRPDAVLPRIYLAESVAGGEERQVLDVDCPEQIGEGAEVDFVEYRFLRVEETRIGVVHELCRVVRGESVEYLDGHIASRLGGEEHLRPVGAASGVDDYLVSFLESRRSPAEYHLLDVGGEFAVGDAARAVVVEGGLVPALLDGILESENEVVFLCEFVHRRCVFEIFAAKICT